MKYQVIATCFYPIALASTQLMNKMLQQGLLERTERAFTGQVLATIDNINGYGCWCNFDTNYHQGKAHPIDEIDEVCKILVQGYECAIKDAEDVGASCSPWEENYEPVTSFTLDTSITQECSQNNPGANDCLLRSCYVESHFVRNLLNVFLGGYPINPENKHSNGFSVGEKCLITKRGGGKGENQCCGDYPERFPFKTNEGERSCCGSKVYNSIVSQCCDPEHSEVGLFC